MTIKNINGKLRVAFLVDSLEVDTVVAETIKFVLKGENFADPVIITGHVHPTSKSLLRRLHAAFKKSKISILIMIIRKFFFWLIENIELKSVKRQFPSYKETINLAEIEGLKYIYIKGRWSLSERYLSLSEDDLRIIDECEIDCIIRCGSGILHGDILEKIKFGVISFHHGDNRSYRGLPSGFWEVMNKEPSTGFIIQRLSNELDGGDVLVRGNVMTQSTWLKNHAFILQKSNQFMNDLILKIAIDKKLPKPEEKSMFSRRILKFPNNIELIEYFLFVLVPIIFKKITSYMVTAQSTRWSVAYAYHKNFTVPISKYIEIENPKGRFLADPFVIDRNGKTYIFVEDFCFRSQKGRISCVEVTSDSYKHLGIVLEEPFHLSFPFVFQHDGEFFMIPETSQNRDIRLYQCTNFPNQWKFVKVLISDISAADTMIFKIENTWYMLTNKCSSDMGDHHSELHILYSRDLMSSSWKEIAIGSPVIFDSTRARNGGYLQKGNKLFRIGQKQALAKYGSAFSINEITEISQNNYSEKTIDVIEAKFKKNITSTHHFSSSKRVAAIDFGRETRLKNILNN